MRRASPRLGRLVAALVAAACSACAGANPKASEPPEAASGSAEAKPADLSPEVLYSRAVKSIVMVKTPAGLGTGFAVDAELIVTNLHVVAGQEEIVVRLPDGDELVPTRVEGADPAHDLVLLRVKKKLPALELVRENKIVLGQSVIAIGNPFGLESTISEGLVSGVRELPDGTKVLQITAPISPGSSGGPILDRRGDVVGVATFVLVGGQNIGFGVPARYVKELLQSDAPMSLAELAELTRVEEREMPRVKRNVPKHSARILDGCRDADLELIAVTIGNAIDVGAPLYNSGNFAACANIYEGAAVDLGRKLPKACAGPRRALETGKKRAAGTGEDFERAWALRDTFDGLIDVIVRKVRAEGGRSPAE